MTVNPSPEFRKKLKACEPEVKHYATCLQIENAKLQRRIAKLEAKAVSDVNRIAALTKQLKKPPIIVRWEG
jgi:hypothetical protein